LLIQIVGADKHYFGAIQSLYLASHLVPKHVAKAIIKKQYVYLVPVFLLCQVFFNTFRARAYSNDIEPKLQYPFVDSKDVLLVIANHYRFLESLVGNRYDYGLITGSELLVIKLWSQKFDLCTESWQNHSEVVEAMLLQKSDGNESDD
jgi:hypothetical protein